eukprot:TRINITY_DN2698_c0_g1_i7.p3 TRINITY_DN2698_c0_g1~~TRINITY_DN2698_c0_g1_i7.p3  ORF type:complete len:137 (-),score=46.88 TRINITY_DN2698_c0_g1_i7:210-620(-)
MTASEEEILEIKDTFQDQESGACVVPENFYMSVPSHQQGGRVDFAQVYSVKNQQTESLLSKLGVNKEFFSKSHDQVHSIAPSPSSTLHDEDGDDNVDDGSDEDNSVEREETGDDHECAHETNAHHAAPSNPEEIEL